MESTDIGRKEMKPSEASKKLEFHSKQICHGCAHPSMIGWCENHCQLPEAFEMAISALKKQEADRWISVTERLPEENGTYLACYEDVTVLLDWFNGKWFFYRTNPAVEEIGTVLAWRLLPEPYKAEEES